MKHIVWLASYPKSGNTWFRAFLANIIMDQDEPVDINLLNKIIRMASSRALFEEATAIETSELSHDEIDIIRPEVYRMTASDTKETLYLKAHDANTWVADDTLLFPLDVTKKVIYFIRNPLDVAVSFAYHSNISIDMTIEKMNDSGHCLCGGINRLDVQLRQKLYSWSGHIHSWLDAHKLPIHLVRYEDMKQNTEETFTNAVSFLGLSISNSIIKKAICFSSIKELQKQEQEKGFYEKHPAAPSFFRRGKVGSWKEALTLKQINSIIRNHKEMMLQYGYLNEDGEPLF